MSYGLLSVRSSNTFGNDLKSGGETSIVKVVGSNLMRVDSLLGVLGARRQDLFFCSITWLTYVPLRWKPSKIGRRDFNCEGPGFEPYESG